MITSKEKTEGREADQLADFRENETNQTNEQHCPGAEMKYPQGKDQKKHGRLHGMRDICGLAVECCGILPLPGPGGPRHGDGCW